MTQTKPLLCAVLICLSLFAGTLPVRAQPADAVSDTIAPVLPAGYAVAVTQKINAIDARLSKQTRKAIRTFQKQEARLQRLLAKKDSAAAAAIFPGNSTYPDQLQQRFTATPDTFLNMIQGQYNAYLDTLRSTLSFLQNGNMSLSGAAEQYEAKLKTATSKLNVLNGKLQQAEAIKKYLRERKAMLRQQLEKYGLGKKIRKLEKTVYYYGQYTREFSEALKDPKKIEEKALALLRQSKPWQKFVQQNSQLASLFRVPVGYGSAQGIAGLQTRQGMEALLTQCIGAAGPNALQEVRSNIQAAQAQLTELKDKAAQYGGNSDADIPGFKPNTAKTKTLRQRIVYDANLQFAKNNPLVPTAADIGLGVGYKLNDKSIIGIGASYRMGLGSWQRIRISHQGVGLRSYVDWQLKKQFYISGGFELNYQAAFSSIAQLRDYNSWQRAGLVGLSKKISVKSKWVKASKVQVLYDMLYRNHIPAGQPVILRTGFGF